MKFYNLFGEQLYTGLPGQITRIMKLTILIITSCLLQVSALTKAQINLNEKNASLESILINIKKQTGTNFLYNIYTLKDANKVTVIFKNATLETVLEKCFDGQPLTYEIKDKTVIVKEKTPSFLEKMVNRFNTININGRVIGNENLPLIGASVSVKGKNGKSTSTNVKGMFYLEKVDQEAVLIFSFIGYLPKEVKASENMGDVVLEQSNSKLDEVQVIAYGTTTQRLSTGNVTTVKAADIEKQPVNNPLLALQGRVPGLFIEQATGFAGTGVKVRIQGQNSINNGNDPLYVIDGVPFTSQLLPGGNLILNGTSGLGNDGSGNPLNFINPQDIESIDILKDADATSIYGSRAANGAILITTKKSKGGDARINFNTQTGIGKVTRKIELMSREQYLEMRKEAYQNDGVNLYIDPYSTDLYKQFLYPDLSGWWDNSRNTDWQKELLGGSAKYYDIQSSISGGSFNSSYLISANYHKETNVFPGDFADTKASMRFNINSSSSNKRLKLELSGFYLYNNNSLPTTDLTPIALMLSPVAPPLYNQDGSLNWVPNESGASTFDNPLEYQSSKFKNNTGNLVGNASLSYLLLKGLELKSNFGYNDIRSTIVNPQLRSKPEEIQYLNSWITKFGNQNITSWLVEPLLQYVGNINNSKLDIVFGATINQERSSSVFIDANGFTTSQVMEDIKSATTLTPTSSIQELYKYSALFSRINYNLSDKLIANFSARRDGSSRFGVENRFHNFWSIGGAYVFSQEQVFKDCIPFLSYGKLRGSYGTTGNDKIGNYKFLSLYSAVNYPVPYQGVNGYLPDGLSNPYLQWEETKKLQFGLDIGFFNDRIFLATNYALNRSSNQLLSLLLPIHTGFSTLPANFNAVVQNSGFECGLTTKNLVSKDLKWTTNINITLPRNKLVRFADLENSYYSTSYTLGESINQQHVFHFLRVDPSTGVYQFSDRNGNPTTTPIPFGSPNTDAVISLNTDPKFYGGIQNSIVFKSFQLDFLLYFTKQIAQNYLFGPFPAGYAKIQQPANLVSRWQSPGQISDFQRYTSSFDLDVSHASAKQSDRGWSDASYIRLKNLSISWEIPESWKNRLAIYSGKFFIQGQNLLTLTNYPGLDPETKSSSSLPPLRVLSVGIQVGI